MRSDEIKKSEPPWVNKLLNFAENLALQPDTLDDSKCPPEWLPDRRVGIDSKLKSYADLAFTIDEIPKFIMVIIRRNQFKCLIFINNFHYYFYYMN